MLSLCHGCALAVLLSLPPFQEPLPLPQLPEHLGLPPIEQYRNWILNDLLMPNLLAISGALTGTAGLIFLLRGLSK